MSTSDQIPVRRLFLEDLAIGQRLESRSTYTVTEDEILAFARHFDPQPFHSDPVSARETFFGALIASGWHTAAMTMRLLATDALPLAEGIIGLGGEISWPNPTRPGDVLRVVCEVVEITPSRSRPDRGVAKVLCSTLNHRDETVQRLVANLIVFARAYRSRG
jgi:acyl dehydratase